MCFLGYYYAHSIYKVCFIHKFLVAGSEDTLIKVVPLDKSEEVFEFSGHEGPILRLDLHTAKGWLASSSGDGTIKIWNINDKKLVRTINGFDKVKSFELAKCFGKELLFLTFFFGG